jgi:hypothetical protein
MNKAIFAICSGNPGGAMAQGTVTIILHYTIEDFS